MVAWVVDLDGLDLERVGRWSSHTPNRLMPLKLGYAAARNALLARNTTSPLTLPYK